MYFKPDNNITSTEQFAQEEKKNLGENKQQTISYTKRNYRTEMMLLMYILLSAAVAPLNGTITSTNLSIHI